MDVHNSYFKVHPRARGMTTPSETQVMRRAPAVHTAEEGTSFLLIMQSVVGNFLF
jgi:hypothetical protein